MRLRPPRHSPSRTEIFRLSANSPELAGILARVLSPQSVDWISRALSGPLSLPPKIAFPAGRDLCWWRLGSNAGSGHRNDELTIVCGSRRRGCLLWVKSGRDALKFRCPLFVVQTILKGSIQNSRCVSTGTASRSRYGSADTTRHRRATGPVL